jgi:predicted DNA-binding WGR domain protein
MSYTAEVTEVQYQDRARNSDKFYRVYLLSDDENSDYRVVFQWGRRGARGQSQNSVYPTRSQAEAAAATKMRSKTDKGYVESYHRELPGVSDDVLELAGVNRFATKTEQPNPDPFVRLTLDVDRCRRLAMGDETEVVEAITVRRTLLDQLAELRTSVSRAEGEVEIVDMLLAAKVG